MESDFFGKLCALLAAITWAGALVLFKCSGEKVPPLPLNLFKNVVGIVLLAITLAVLGDGPATLGDFPREDLYLLVISGVIGIALADTIMFHSLNLIGVGLFSLVDGLYSPCIILLSATLLSERPSMAQYLGAALVVVGVMVSSGHAPPPNRTRWQLVAGMLLGVLAIVLVGLGIVMVKPVLESDDFPILWATMVRMLAATVALFFMAMASSNRKLCWSVFRPSAVWRVSIPAAVLGTYLAMILWIAGFKFTTASVASILNQTAVVFALILATVALKERFTTRKLVATILVMGGIVVVALGNVILEAFSGP